MFGGVWITVKVANVGVVRKWKCLSNGRLGENDQDGCCVDGDGQQFHGWHFVSVLSLVKWVYYRPFGKHKN